MTSWRRSTSKTSYTITLVQNKIRYDRRLTVREVANDVSISIGICHSILPDEFLKEVVVIASEHSALSIREFLASKNTPVISHPPYSSDFYS